MSFKKSVKISYLHDNSLERQRTSQLDVISKLVLMIFTLFCFGSSTAKAIGDLFFALDDRQYYCANVVSIVAALLPMILFMNLSNRENAGKSKWIIRILVLFVYVISTTLYISTKKEELSEGILQVRYYVVDAINYYYKLNLRAEWIESEHLDFTLTVILFCILTVFLYVTILVETRMFLITVPVIFYTGTMCVGYAPKLSSVTYLMLGVLIANMGAWEKYQTAWAKNKTNKKFNALVLSIMAAIILTMLSTFSLRDKSKIMIEKGAPKLKAIQKELDDKIKNKYEKKLQALAEKYEGEDKEIITNREPLYDEKDMFSVEINAKPKANMYFREFYGMRYVGGAWESRRDITESVEKQHDLEPGELAQQMNENLKPKMENFYAEIAEEMPYYSGTIEYATETKTVWIPDIYEIEDKVYYAGEYLASRNASDENIDFGGCNVTLNFVLENQELSESAYGDYYSWYNDYADKQYKAGCEDVPTASKISATITEFLDEYYSGQANFYSRNLRRICAAYLVSDYLSKASYNLELKGVMGNVDSVEYFLATSHEGFCIHFASAGAIILQEMGIPARYASGYMLSPSQFKRDGDMFRADALDSDGHAWVEIYLDNIGWFPVEMTSGHGGVPDIGFDNFDLSIENDPNTNQDDIDTLEDNKPDTTDSTTENNTSESTQMTTATEQLQSTEITGNEIVDNEGLSTESQSSLEEISDASKKNNARKNNVIKNILLVFAILSGLGFCFYLNRRNKHSRKKVDRYVGQDNRKALELINENLLRRIKRKNYLLSNNFSDDEFRKMLIKDLVTVDKSQVDQYIQIMQKAKFSNHDISKEEVEFCIKLCYTTANENKKE